MSEKELVGAVKKMSEKQKQSLVKKLASDLYLNNKSKGALVSIQEKIVSRKLLVFIIATCLMIWTALDPETWAMIATMYIGGQSVIDVAKVWKGM